MEELEQLHKKLVKLKNVTGSQLKNKNARAGWNTAFNLAIAAVHDLNLELREKISRKE